MRTKDKKTEWSAETDPLLHPSKIYRCFCMAFTAFTKMALNIHNRIYFQLKVSGQENLKAMEGPAITICNHVNLLDCAMIACSVKNHRVFFPAKFNNVKKPVIGSLVKWLGGIPIENTSEGYRILSNRVEYLLAKGNFVHIFPEGELIFYDPNLRKFKNGAFWYAYNCDVPIVPMMITYRKREGWRGFFFRRKKRSLNLTIFPPVYPDRNKARIEEVIRLKEHCRMLMESAQDEGREQESPRKTPSSRAM